MIYAKLQTPYPKARCWGKNMVKILRIAVLLCCLSSSGLEGLTAAREERP